MKFLLLAFWVSIAGICGRRWQKVSFRRAIRHGITKIHATQDARKAIVR